METRNEHASWTFRLFYGFGGLVWFTDPWLQATLVWAVCGVWHCVFGIDERALVECNLKLTPLKE